MDIYQALDLDPYPARRDAGKSAPIIRTEEPEKNAGVSDVEKILTAHYGPRRRTGAADFDREAYNAEASKLDEEYSSRVTAERSATERAAAQSTLDSLRANGRGSSHARAAYKFER
ncbi:MAG TPA: hypothetical protein VNY51_09405 [Candidatus Dormibacteraeota bacterium]|nr:hypothetical protein [Candidatus Dormibacteraeota bacterium]